MKRPFNVVIAQNTITYHSRIVMAESSAEAEKIMAESLKSSKTGISCDQSDEPTDFKVAGSFELVEKDDDN